MLSILPAFILSQDQTLKKHKGSKNFQFVLFLNFFFELEFDTNRPKHFFVILSPSRFRTSHKTPKFTFEEPTPFTDSSVVAHFVGCCPRSGQAPDPLDRRSLQPLVMQDLCWTTGLFNLRPCSDPTGPDPAGPEPVRGVSCASTEVRQRTEGL